MPIASGVSWVDRFPTRADIGGCVSPFRENLEAFIAALKKAGAAVTINATLRPPERAYLMRSCWLIAHGKDPRTVEPMAGVDIDWVHRDGSGQPDLAKSRAVAQQMVKAYGIVAEPSLTSLHIKGLAVDMDISWSGAPEDRRQERNSAHDQQRTARRHQPSVGRHRAELWRDQGGIRHRPAALVEHRPLVPRLHYIATCSGRTPTAISRPVRRRRIGSHCIRRTTNGTLIWPPADGATAR